MSIYETVLNQKEYLEVTEKIGKIKFITDGKWDWEHGLGHYQRVARYVRRILEQLGADDRMIDLGMTAALLHDIGLSESGPNKKDHALKSSRMFQKFLINTNVTPKEEEMMAHAIKDHSNGNDMKTLLDISLLLADKLDVTYHRTIDSSIQDSINKEFQKIKSVDIEITEKNLIVKYKVDGIFDFGVAKEWAKMITIPKKVATYLKKNCIFMVNHQVVNLE